MKCCLCEYYHEDDTYLHTLIKGFAVCYCCYSDMDFQTEVAFHSFVENLIRVLPDKSDIKKSAFPESV